MKLENAQEIALRFLLNDKTSSYAVLLEKSNSTTLHVRRIKDIACDLFKSLNDFHPSSMKEIFKKKDVLYYLRDFYQPNFEQIAYGKKYI